MQNFLETANLPLFAADFDYFRLSPPQWELMLIRLKQMGTNLVMIALPWAFHEIEPGIIDLDGTTNPRRDVVSVLNLCYHLDIPCLIGIGPDHMNGVLNDGRPRWISNTGEEDEEEGFTAAVESWYKGLSPRLIDRQWPDGPIIAVKPGHETTGPQRSALSKQLTEVRWPIWLRKRYGTVDALNNAYGTAYRTVNEVTFPASWADATTPLETDAEAFIAEVRAEVRRHYTQTLLEAGWQVPIFPPTTEVVADLPVIQSYHTLADIVELSPTKLAGKIFNLQQPIQVQPNPADIGLSPAWATTAPIRADGSLRRTFWQLRHQFWSHSLPETNRSNGTIVATFDGITLASCSHDTPLKLDVPPDTKPVPYRLRANGELFIEETFKVRRKKLSGHYIAEDETDQTDLMLFLADPDRPLTDFPQSYLASLLAGQTETLARTILWVETLAQMLTLPPAVGPGQAPPRHPKQTLNTLEEARRGLREADIALRKAMSSIGGLELGFSTILDKDQAEAILPSTPASATISPALFEGPAREILLEIGALCAELAPPLKAAVADLRQILAAPERLTVDRYRRSYDQAATTARLARQPLLDTISRLRFQINSEKLPLVLWPVHDQLQNIAELLRWGVLRW